MTWENAFARQSMVTNTPPSGANPGRSQPSTAEPRGNGVLLGGMRAGDKVQQDDARPLRPEFLALVAMARQIRRDVQTLEAEIERIGRAESSNWEDYIGYFDEGALHDGATWRDDATDDAR